MCTAEDLLTAAKRLEIGSSGDARTVRAAAEAMRKGRATPQQIAHAKKLARGVLARRRAN